MIKILIAEDDLFLKEISETKLLKAGYQVISVSDGDAVIFEINKQKPSLLLLDVALPHKNGVDILAEIRNTPEISDLKVLLFTNQSGVEIEEVAKKYNAEYFMKALTGSGELVDKIEEMLQ
jgi:DNA-binding response OmpR family regulator